MTELNSDSEAAQKVPGSLETICAGSLSGMAGKVLEYPFDTIKVRLQSQPSSEKALYSSTLDCVRQTFRQEGYKGFYRGLSAPMVGAMFENAILFVSFAKASDLVRSIRGLQKQQELDTTGVMLAGAMSGIVTSFVLTPIELVKCQLQVQTTSRHTAATNFPKTTLPIPSTVIGNPKLIHTTTNCRPAQSIPSLILEIHRTSGYRGFWRGQSFTMIRESGGSCCWFSIYELSLRHLRPHGTTKQENTQSDMMMAGALAGVGYNTIFFPADTVKSRMQTNASRAGLIGTIEEVWRTHGIRGYFKGWGITVARAAPSNAIIFWVYESLMREFARSH